jgi:citrate synthase
MTGQPAPRYPTSLGTSDADTITLLGQNLADDLMGKVGFGELTLWMVTQRRPTPQQVRVFEAVLVALADHGFTPTAIAARVTYLSAPDSVQGALAAGLLGGGSRFLGVTEDCGQFLANVLASAQASGQRLPSTDAEFDDLALAAVKSAREAKKFVPGLGHPVHKVRDPRTPALIKIASEEGVRGPHLRLFEAIGRVHPRILGRTLPLNGAGVCGAVLADLGLPLSLLRGFALLARCAGLLGQLAEEERQPIANDIYLSVDRNAVYVDPELSPDIGSLTVREPPWRPSQRSSPRPITPSTTGLRPQRVRTGQTSPTSGSARSRSSGRLSPGLTPMSWFWSAATTSTSCGWTTCRSFSLARRRSTTRTGTTRNANSACPRCSSRARRTCPRISSARAWTLASTWRSATSCASTTASPAR